MSTLTPPRPDTTSTPSAPAQSPTPRRGPRAPRPVPQGGQAVTGTAFTMLAIVCLWVLVQMLFLSGAAHARSQTLLYDRFRGELAGLTAPLGTAHCDLNDPTSPLCAIPEGDPVAIVSIPAIGMHEVVVEGTSAGDLQDGPGHLVTTVLPGQQGTSVLYGRRTTYGAPFGDITRLQTGDIVDVTTAQGVSSLKVLDVRHAGDPVAAAPPTGAARLTLITAESSGGFLSALAPDRTVYVDAQARKGQAGVGNLPTTVPDAQKAMARDYQALPLLALYLALLVALTVGVVLARQRWSAALVWVAALPLVLAVAWASTDAFVQFLPNLI